MGIIYILRNKINNKIYVGKTQRKFTRRFYEHLNSKTPIGNALRKHGASNFAITLIEDIPDDQLNEEEIKCIRECNSVAPHGYNLTYGGEGCVPSEETRKILSESHKGQIPWIKGKHHTEESRKKMSKSQKERFEHEPSPMKGRHHTEEAKEKISKFFKGKFAGENNPFYGKHHTEEAKEKCGVVNIGNTYRKGAHHTEEAKKKMSESHKGKISPMKGKHHTEEAKEKNRQKHLGVIPSNKGIRTPHLCPVCKKPCKEKYSGTVFKGYYKTCGDKTCISFLRNKKIPA